MRVKNLFNRGEDDIGNSFKQSNLPVSPDVLKNNEINRQAMVFDYGTAVNYEGNGMEPDAIAHIKEKVVRKSMTNKKEP